MTRQVYTVETHKDRSGWAIIFLAALMIAFYKWIVVTIMFALFVTLIYRYHKFLKEREDRKISRDAALAWRAECQNRQYLAGDPLGMEGDYPCETMPITDIKWDPTKTLNLDNFDDGLREWK